MLRWRGSWAASPGGVNGGEKFLPLPLFSFRSQWLSPLRFGFLVFGFGLLFSVYCYSPLYFIRSFSLFGLPIYRKKNMEQVCFSCVPSITQRLVGHWGEFGGGGGEERERERRGIFSKIFRLLFC